jgi:hypothetical protein
MSSLEIFKQILKVSIQPIQCDKNVIERVQIARQQAFTYRVEQDEIDRFDSVVCMQNGALYCARFTRTLSESETANTLVQGEGGSSKVAKTILKVNIKWVHDCLGHLSKDATGKIAAHLGMELSRTTFQTCESCAIGKAKQHNIPKEVLGEIATIFNGRVGRDLSKIKAPEGMKVTINKSNWHMMVYEATGFKRSAFFQTKDGIINYMCKMMHSNAL